MKALVRKSVVRQLLLMVLTLFPAGAWAGQDHPSAKHRSLLGAIEKLKPAGTTAGGLQPQLWPAAECPPARSSNDSPGLVIKAGGFAPGASEPTYDQTFQYDRHGNLTYWSASPETPNWFTRECAYADRGDSHLGKLVYMREDSSQWKGPVYHVTYNERDQIDVETEDILKPDGTLDFRIFTRYVYDAAGYVLEQNVEVDDPLDGTIDYQSAIVLSRNEQGQYTRIVLGYYDVPGGVFTPYRTEEYSPDSGLATEYRDYNGDGVADTVSKDWHTFDDQGRVKRVVQESDYYGRSDGGADGIVDSSRLLLFEYDTDGNLVRETYDTFPQDGWPWRFESLYAYSARGWVMKQVNNVDDFIDGVNDEVTTITVSRDQRGKMTEYLAVSTNVYSSHKWSTREVFVYDGIGNLIQTMSSSWFDDDPPPPLSKVFAFQYAAGRSGQPGSGKD